MHSTPFEVLIMIRYKNVQKLFIIVLKKVITSSHPPCLENHQQRKPAKIGTSQDFEISLETHPFTPMPPHNQPHLDRKLLRWCRFQSNQHHLFKFSLFACAVLGLV